MNSIQNQINNFINSSKNFIPDIIGAFLLLLVFIILAKIARLIAEKIVHKVNRKPSVVRLASFLTYVLVLTIGLLFSLRILGLDGVVTSVLAGAGILGLALGFAFQDIASNFIAGVAIVSQKQFNVGDLVEVNKIFGKVKRIDLRTTTIQTLDGLTVYIPNKDIFLSQVKDYTNLGMRRVELSVGVSYSDDLKKVKELTLKAIQNVPQYNKEEPTDLYFEEFGESSINFIVRFWVNFKKQTDFLEARSLAVMNIKSSFDTNNITIPFPIRTLSFDSKDLQQIKNN